MRYATRRTVSERGEGVAKREPMTRWPAMGRDSIEYVRASESVGVSEWS